jgi:hypothetical protein
VQVTPPWNVNLVATLRFSGAAGSAKLNGKVRLPKERCTYLSGVGGLLVTKIAMGLEKMNTDLATKVGKSCSSIIPSSSIKVSGYLGANPSSRCPWCDPTGKLDGGRQFEVRRQHDRSGDGDRIGLVSKHWLL